MRPLNLPLNLVECGKNLSFLDQEVFIKFVRYHGTFLRRLDPMICPACKSESLMIWTTLAPKVWFCKFFWHNRLQCKSYQRPRSAAGAELPVTYDFATEL
jgi:hypothetical protein